MKLPAIQFYPGDWKKDIGVQSLSFHDRGIWFELLMLMHDSEQRGKLVLNGRPMPDEMIARAIGLDNQTFNQTLTNLLTFGVASRDEESGALMSRRMVKDENLRQTRIKAGKLGGNPVLLKQEPTTGVKQKPTPSSSSSTTKQTSTTRGPATAEAVAAEVTQHCGITNNFIRDAIVAAARQEREATGDPGAVIRDRMITAVMAYREASLEYTVSFERFFNEGLWLKPDSWPWKGRDRGSNKGGTNSGKPASPATARVASGASAFRKAAAEFGIDRAGGTHGADGGPVSPPGHGGGGGELPLRLRPPDSEVRNPGS